MMDAPGTIRLTLAAPVARLTIDHPRRRNALTGAMLRELDAAAERLAAAPQVRVVLIDAAPGACFCAGGDVTEWGALPPGRMGPGWIRDGNRAFARLAALPAVSIALLGGDALGGGLELALAADFRIAADGIRLGFPETGIGAIPGWLGGVRLGLLAGPAVARRLVLLGELLDARAARDADVVDEVVPAAQLAARGQAMAEAVLRRAPTATVQAKRLLAPLLDPARHAAAHEAAADACLGSPDGAEGLRAFRARRAPDYAGMIASPRPLAG